MVIDLSSFLSNFRNKVFILMCLLSRYLRQCYFIKFNAFSISIFEYFFFFFILIIFLSSSSSSSSPSFSSWWWCSLKVTIFLGLLEINKISCEEETQPSSDLKNDCIISIYSGFELNPFAFSSEKKTVSFILPFFSYIYIILSKSILLNSKNSFTYSDNLSIADFPVLSFGLEFFKLEKSFI